MSSLNTTFRLYCSATIIGLACLTVPALADTTKTDDIAALKAEAIGIMKKFGKSLKDELKKAKKAGGPLAAIDACKTKAPALTNEASVSSGWTVARTSLKLRNQNNRPNAHELEVMQEFEKRLAGGEKAKKMAHAEIEEENGVKTFHFMKAIGTNKLCLGCHGAPKGELKARLEKLYPEDKALGYKSGDIRGIFSLSKVLGTKADPVSPRTPMGSH